MNALKARDLLFTELHNSLLKSEGFRKKGSWSILNIDSMFLTVHLRSSRWCNSENVQFWIDIQVFNRDYHELIFSPKKFQGPSESTPSLVSLDLSKMCTPKLPSFNINNSINIPELTIKIKNALKVHGLPLLYEFKTLEGILNYYKHNEQLKNSQDYSLCACINFMLNNPNEARHLFKLAKECAPHENFLKHLEDKEHKIFSNPSFRRDA